MDLKTNTRKIPCVLNEIGLRAQNMLPILLISYNAHEQILIVGSDQGFTDHVIECGESFNMVILHFRIEVS